MTQPLFIIGNPRSGTSLLRLMLTCHSQIFIPPECAFIVWWFNKYINWNKDISDEQIQEFVDDLFESKKFEFWQLSKQEFHKHLIEEKPHNYHDLIRFIFTEYARQHKITGYKYWGDKNNYYVNYVDKLYQLFPLAKFIQIVRDGRDVATSYLALKKQTSKSKYAPKLPHDIINIAKEWNTNNNKIHDSFSKISPSQTITVRYEDLIEHTIISLTRLCAFLELEYEPNMLNYYKINQEHNLEPEEFKDWKIQTFKKVNKDGINKYISALSEEELSVFEAESYESLRRYEYI